MIQIHDYKDAIDFVYEDVICESGCPQEVSDLYDWIEENGKAEELDFFMNQEFPHGADRDELQEFIIKNWTEIADELGYEYTADTPIIYHVYDIEWDADDEEYGEIDASTDFAPTECEVAVYERNCDLDDVIANKLSDEYGYCVNSFLYEEKGEEE